MPPPPFDAPCPSKCAADPAPAIAPIAALAGTPPAARWPLHCLCMPARPRLAQPAPRMAPARSPSPSEPRHMPPRPAPPRSRPPDLRDAHSPPPQSQSFRSCVPESSVPRSPASRPGRRSPATRLRESSVLHGSRWRLKSSAHAPVLRHPVPASLRVPAAASQSSRCATWKGWFSVMSAVVSVIP